MTAIEFWFDFSSPYAYLASEWIAPVAARHGRTVSWQPMLLGAAFKASGQAPLTEVPLKGDYSLRDFERSARYDNVAYRHPTVFPIGTVHAARAVLWLKRSDPAREALFIHAAFRAVFVQDRNISDIAVLTEVIREAGIDATPLLAGIAQQDLKDQLKAQVDAGLARGVFGSPFMFIDGEPFWGNDRRPHVERWLSTGPF